MNKELTTNIKRITNIKIVDNKIKVGSTEPTENGENETFGTKNTNDTGRKNSNGPVVYWMSRDQRVFDNWALIRASEISKENNVPLYVIFCLDVNFKNAGLRHFTFMLQGLKQVEKDLNSLNIPFIFIEQNPSVGVAEFCNNNNVSTLITDFSPLKIKKNWLWKIVSSTNCNITEVDAHNIVSCKYVSQKCEFAAYTLRPKIHKLLDEFLTEYPNIEKQDIEIVNNNKIKMLSSYHNSMVKNIDFEQILNKLNCDKSIKPINWLKPGSKNALKVLEEFIKNRFEKYDELRNNPNYDMQSNLSPYLHYGHISAQTVALKIKEISGFEESKKAFLEELIVRKELSDNYCYYNEDYDNFNGFHDWSKKSFNEVKNDKREYIYTKEQLENASTHDDLWNAAQNEMVYKGKMHGYLRMYWAKKILEWTESVQKAQEIAIYLNDKYELDGRDANGYTGIAWSIGGVHDRAWFNRPIYGKIRYMSYNGCKSKFNIDAYIKKVQDFINKEYN